MHFIAGPAGRQFVYERGMCWPFVFQRGMCWPFMFQRGMCWPFVFQRGMCWPFVFQRGMCLWCVVKEDDWFKCLKYYIIMMGGLGGFIT